MGVHTKNLDSIIKLSNREKYTVARYIKKCNCRAVGECNHNIDVEYKALDACLNAFKAHMKKKLYKKAMEGNSGWDVFTKEKIVEIIKKHLEKGDMVDVANLAMFAWNSEAENGK